MFNTPAYMKALFLLKQVKSVCLKKKQKSKAKKKKKDEAHGSSQVLKFGSVRSLPQEYKNVFRTGLKRPVVV
jgi:hypothetical protein